MHLELWRIHTPERSYVIVAQEQGLQPSATPALFLKAAPSNARPQVAISFGQIDQLSKTAKRLGPIHGCLGLLHSGQDIFLAVVDSAISIGSQVREDVFSRIASVSFYCLTSALWDTRAVNDSYDSSDTTLPPLENPCSGISKILSNGNFYYSNIDLSSRTEVRMQRGNNASSEYDDRFLWNAYMLDSLLGFRSALTPHERGDFDRAAFLVMAIQGYIGVYDLNMGGVSGAATLTLSVISRLGSRRAGTRFTVRGIDDEGNVANYVETETVLRTQTRCFSYVQLRGSIPLFWEQQGMQPFGQKLVITRPPIASQPAFEQHFRDVLSTYPKVHIMNLLGTRDQEALLTQAYEGHLRQALASDPLFARGVEMTNFDFHSRTKLGGLGTISDQLKQERRITATSENLGYCLLSTDENGHFSGVIRRQGGVYRTNCLDCLDRTNVVQDILSRISLEHYLKSAFPEWVSNEAIWSRHSVLWAENGDALAKIYAGTGALNTSFTRSGKKTLAGVLSDATKSVGRMYQSNFADTGKQQAIDELLGNLNGQMKVAVFDPVHEEVEEAVKARAAEYSLFEGTTLWIGTYNLNGRSPGQESILPWLFPDGDVHPDLLVVGFQEIVQLNAGQILATDPEKKRRWESHINQILAQRRSDKAEYVILRSDQLVGTALFIIVKTSAVPFIRNVEASTKKTGLKGMAGNKGGIAIRLNYKDSSFCFITAHFAAGSNNVDERDRDYRTISQGIQFRRGLTIADHDNVIWLGDFNYRTTVLTSLEARTIATGTDYTELLQFDQLQASMNSRRAFAGFSEAPITFKPTYKYDTGTDVYDSSEKQRVPSWTDRILYKGEGLDVTKYQSVDLRLSDHRPVFCLVRGQIKTIDTDKKGRVSEEVLKAVRSKLASLPKPSAKPSPLQRQHPLPDTEWWVTEDEPEGLVSEPKLWTAPNPFAPIPRKPIPQTNATTA